MISYYDGQLTDIMPGNITSKPEVQALSYALQQACRLLYQYSRRIYIYSNLDEQPEEVIDLLALELRTQYYRNTLDLATKRQLVKNTLIWYMGAGTPQAVEELVSAVFGKGKVLEWFEYGGDPFFFRVELENAEISPGQNEEFRKMLGGIKRLSAHLDALSYAYRYILKHSIACRARLECMGEFYPRYNIPPLRLDGTAFLDGRYLLNGYREGTQVDFYPASMGMAQGIQAACAWHGDFGIFAGAEAQVEAEALFDISGGSAVHAESKGGLQVSGGASVLLRCGGRLVVEQDLAYLDGDRALDGSWPLGAGGMEVGLD